MLQAKCIIMIGSPSKAVLNSQDTTSRVRRTRTHADAQLHNWHCSFKLFLEMARGQISRCFGGAKRAVCFSAEFQFEGNDDPTNICVICMNLYLIHLKLGH